MTVYDFPSVIAVKFVVRRDDTVLVLREPETNSWMPDRLALPGGKLLLNESIDQAITRKIETEIGFSVTVKGLVKIIDILMPDKNVYHFIILADYKEGEIDTTKTESNELKWLIQAELQSLSKDNFAEWYNIDLLQEVLHNQYQTFPLSLITTQNNSESEILDWMKKGNTNAV